MAQLPSGALDSLTADVVGALSNGRTIVPVAHEAVRAAIEVIDAELNTAEVAILAAVVQPTRDWLTANQHIARQVVEAVEAKRRELL